MGDKSKKVKVVKIVQDNEETVVHYRFWDYCFPEKRYSGPGEFKVRVDRAKKSMKAVQAKKESRKLIHSVKA